MKEMIVFPLNESLQFSYSILGMDILSQLHIYFKRGIMLYKKMNVDECRMRNLKSDKGSLEEGFLNIAMPLNDKKIFILGEGRVGKTALCNSMMGKPFEETESILSCNIRRAVVTGNGGWTEHEESEREESDTVVGENSSMLLLIDYGCPAVFKIMHPLFLTSYGVYVVVFSMADMLGSNERQLDNNSIEQSLNNISFWINSMQTMTRKAVRVFLVGTHKDVVSNFSEHLHLSDKIRERYEHNLIWPSVQENQDICFFPVDNRVSQRDDVIKNLITKLEQAIRDSRVPCIPLSWRKTWDGLVGTKKAVIGLTEAASLSIGYGVERNAVPSLLSFLHEIGEVLWLDDRSLRDILILDIIDIFVEPATLIIYDHISKPLKSHAHHKIIQQDCKKKFSRRWVQMIERGIVDLPVVEFLLNEALRLDIMPRHRAQYNIIPIIVGIMLKYGLLVRLEEVADRVLSSGAHTFPDKYLIPSLLPSIIGDPTLFVDDNWNDTSQFFSCYFVFSSQSDIKARESFPSTWLKHYCYLPRGLFYQLIARCSKLCQISTEITHFYKNYALLIFERQRFRLICVPEINCIRLDVEGEYPVPVHDVISVQVRKIVEEFKDSLQFVTALRFSNTSESQNGFLLVNLESVRDVQLDGAKPISMLHDCDIKGKFGPWLINTDLLPFYDVYISHCLRANDADDLFLHLVKSVVCTEKRALQVFYEKVRLKMFGHRLKVCGKALINSSIFVTTLYNAVLQEMLNHNPNKIDNKLIEWMLALECMLDSIHSEMQMIFLVKLEDLENCLSIGDLPETVPVTSIAVVRRILEENGFSVRSSLTNRTVRSIVEDIYYYSGYTYLNFRDLGCQIIDAITSGSSEYKGVSRYLRRYTPLITCKNYLLYDLPTILPEVMNICGIVDLIDSIVKECFRDNECNPYGLSFDEVFAVKAYTSEVHQQNSLFFHVNNVLRLRKNEALNPLRPYLSYLMTAIEKIPPVVTTLYRVIPICDITKEKQNYSVGRKIEWTAFTSTSSDRDSALQFRDWERPYIMFQINAISGRNLTKYSLQPKESEYILSPNSQFTVYQSPEVYGNMLVVKMNETSAEDTLVF